MRIRVNLVKSTSHFRLHSLNWTIGPPLPDLTSGSLLLAFYWPGLAIKDEGHISVKNKKKQLKYFKILIHVAVLWSALEWKIREISWSSWSWLSSWSWWNTDRFCSQFSVVIWHHNVILFEILETVAMQGCFLSFLFCDTWSCQSTSRMRHQLSKFNTSLSETCQTQAKIHVSTPNGDCVESERLTVFMIISHFRYLGIQLKNAMQITNYKTDIYL